MKIDRERLKEALSNSIFVQKGCEPIMEAAQLLLDITAPDYVMSKDMVRSAFDADCDIDAPSVIFRAMIGELVK